MGELRIARLRCVPEITPQETAYGERFAEEQRLPRNELRADERPAFGGRRGQRVAYRVIAASIIVVAFGQARTVVVVFAARDNLVRPAVDRLEKEHFVLALVGGEFHRLGQFLARPATMLILAPRELYLPVADARLELLARAGHLHFLLLLLFVEDGPGEH